MHVHNNLFVLGEVFDDEMSDEDPSESEKSSTMILQAVHQENRSPRLPQPQPSSSGSPKISLQWAMSQ